MNNTSKIIIFFVICLAIWWGYDNFVSNKITIPQISDLGKTDIEDNTTNENKTEKEEEKEEPAKENNKEDSYIYIYMLTTDKSGGQFLKPVKRPLAPGKDKLSQAVTLLLEGPNNIETSNGIYSEIPNSAKLISVTTQDDRITINLSNSFVNGGGSDSTYSRMRQLIKTVLVNSDKPVYLQLDGKQADIIGGEGITVSQPLRENSLDE